MKIVTWNCNGAFRKKYEAIEEFDADLLVIQECEDPSQSTRNYAEWAANYLWIGRNKNKGIGVFAKKGISIEKLDWPDDNLLQFLPCRINDEINLLAVWTMQANSPTFQYIGQFWKYLQLYKDRMSDQKTIICGDFNSNVIWDQWDRWWNHSDVVRELAELDIHSMYHKLTGEDHGKEKTPTLFLHRKKERPYHIDYAFVSISMMNGSIEVGHPDQWLAFSDHMPLVFHLPYRDLEVVRRTIDKDRDLLRRKIWEILPIYKNQYQYDPEGMNSEYTHSAIMELWKVGFSDQDDRRKAVLLLHSIMFHDRMNSEGGNFKFIDDHKEVIEKILKCLD